METNEIRTAHFTLTELCNSDTADKKHINNTPKDARVVANLCNLMSQVLEPARQQLGVPVIVTSGYRCEKLNRAVGGVGNSQHLKGQAADLVCTKREDKERLFEILTQMDIDQLLWETNSKGTQWIHVSYVSPDKNRHYINRNYRAR